MIGKIHSLFLRCIDALITDEKRQAVLRALSDQAELAIRAGVSPSASEWLWLSPIERAAWTRAGDLVGMANAARNALASQTTDGALALASKVDGGKSKQAYESERKSAMLQEAVRDFKSRWAGA